MIRHSDTSARRILSLTAALGMATAAMAGTAPAPAIPAPAEDAGSPLLNTSRPCICLGADTGVTSAEDPLSASLTFSYDTTFFCRGMDMGDDVWSAWLNADVRIMENLT
jgi:hypothetical protein